MFTFKKSSEKGVANVDLGNIHSQFEVEYMGKKENKEKLTKCADCNKDLNDGDVCIIKDSVLHHTNCKAKEKAKEEKPKGRETKAEPQDG